MAARFPSSSQRELDLTDKEHAGIIWSTSHRPITSPPPSSDSLYMGRALSIRQPFAELILRGIKTIEYRSRPTRIIGERFHIYAGKKPAALGEALGDKAWSNDLDMPDSRGLPEWMLELAQQIKLIPQGLVLPRGVIVGSAVIEKV